MKIGEITISDSISLIFFIYEFGLHVTFFITSIVVFVRIITKGIQRFIDILKMMQLISIFLWLFGRSIAGLLVLIGPEVYDHLAVLIINNINDLIFFHYGLNQLSWYVLVQHLLSYRQIANGMSYEDGRVKVKHKEKVGIIVVVAIYIVLIIFVTILNILLYSNRTSFDVVYTIYFFVLFTFVGALSINEYLLYSKVKETMKSTLNYYYQVAKTNINLIFVTNIGYYLSGMIFAVFILIFKIDEVKMKGYGEGELYEDWKRILYMLADFIVFTPIILYIYMNTKNINFKDWMVDVMIGYKMLNHYSNCSIFIKVNGFKSNSYESIIDDEIFPTSTEESNRNLEKDYEDTDEYMRNFKQHYLGLNGKSRESSFQ